MAGDGSDTVTRRKRTSNSKEVKNVSRKDKKTREVEGAGPELLKDNLAEKVTEETSADIQKELTEKLAGLLERDRLGVSLQ